MSSKAIVLDYFQSSTRDVEKALACFAPGAEFHTPLGPLPFPDGVRAYLGGYGQSFPDSGFDITRVIQDGDELCAEGFWFGTHTGAMQTPDGGAIPPTNRHVRAPFVTCFTVKGGKITSHRGYWDMAGFFRQLGLGQ